MTPKELMLAALRHEQTPRPAWVPFAGVHAGKLTGADAREVLTDENKLLEALLAANRLYKPDGQPVLFDLQLEAEALGCQLKWSPVSPPSVASHPLQDTMTVPCYCTLPGAQSARIPLALNVMRRLKAEVGQQTALFGLICGPFTLALHLRGNNLFMDMYDEEEYVHELLAYCAQCARRMAGLYIEAGMDVIALVDPLVSQISAAHFDSFLGGVYRDLFAHIRALGAHSSFFVCGDATRNIEPMCKTAPDAIFVDENVDLAAARAITQQYNIALGGNIPLTTVMLHGSQQDNMKYVADMLEGLAPYRNVIVAPGCDMPYDVPVENTIGAAQAVFLPDQTRQMLKDYVAVDEEMDVALPDYANLARPLVEVFLLDPDACAACTYMLGAADEAKRRFGSQIDLAEYRYTIKEDIARIKKMGVQKLPSIYINGQLQFSSLIPSPQALDEKIRAALTPAP